MAIKIQLVKLKKVVDSLLEYVKRDWDSANAGGDEQNSFLYKVLEGASDDGFDFYSEAKSLFLRTDNSPRKINTRIIFSKDIAQTPTITIREPARLPGSFNSIGRDTGSSFGVATDPTRYENEYRYAKRGEFEIMITASNQLQVIIISDVIYSLLLAGTETLNHTLDFVLHSLSLKELIANNELVPYPLYIRTITISTESEDVVPSIQRNELIEAINFVISDIYN